MALCTGRLRPKLSSKCHRYLDAKPNPHLPTRARRPPNHLPVPPQAPIVGGQDTWTGTAAAALGFAHQSTPIQPATLLSPRATIRLPGAQKWRLTLGRALVDGIPMRAPSPRTEPVSRRPT